MAPNPFFPSFGPIRNPNIRVHNVGNHFNLNSQSAYSPSGFKHNEAFKNNTYNNEYKNDNKINFNYCSPKNEKFCIDNNKNNDEENEKFFEIFGIKLYFDDLLIIALLFFLYKEECTDDSLFIILILLLLT